MNPIAILINNFKPNLEKMAIQGHGTPGTTRFKIVRPNNEDKIPTVIQYQYWFGVGMLLYFIKHSKT
jgi:hypothetical protein